jgi:hypothetical protein
MAHDIVKKIQKMVALASSTDSMAEAESIMVKVRQLLDQHGITLLSIGEASAVSDDPVGTSRDVYGFWAAEGWAKKLSAAAAEYYGVEVIWTKRGNFTQIAVVGRESCRAAFTAMMPYFRGQVRRLAQRGWANHHYRSMSVGASQIGTALTYRLFGLAAENRVQAATPTKAAAGMNMLVPVDEIQIETMEAFPRLKPVTIQSRVRVKHHAIEAARSIPLADQLRKEGAPEFVITKR